MPKRLVVCCDGTWNVPDQIHDGKACPTNVTKVAVAVARQDSGGTPQVVYYHPGVGTRRWERLRGGAFGFGLSRDVQAAYRFLVDNYEEDDELFFFGFSRGAFTARSTAGLVRNAGILRREHADRLGEAYDLYRDRATHPRDLASRLFRRSYSYEPKIRFIGVWDTVGALGIPLSGVPVVELINRRWSFHDTELSSIVQGAFHAVAVDERRRPFRPTVWTGAPAEEQRVEQVWFAGVHSDVGGGYPEAGLSDISLLWMVDRARQYGLAFEEDAFTPEGGWGAADSHLPAIAPDLRGDLHDSMKGIYRSLGPAVRDIGAKAGAPGEGGTWKTGICQSAAESAVLRRHQDPDYPAPNLAEYLAGEPPVTPVPLAAPGAPN